MDKSVTIEYKINSTAQITIEVSHEVKEVLEQTTRQVQSQRRQDRRRIDFTPLTDELLEISIKSASEDTAVLYEQIEQNKRLYAAMEQLTEIQRRRVYLYYFRGMKQREIAALEGVNYAAIGSSIRQSLKRLHKIFNEQ